jgi:hypothetical protein
MSLSASVCSRLQHQHETIHELLIGFSEDQLRQRLHKRKMLHEAHYLFSIFVLTRSAAPGYHF